MRFLTAVITATVIVACHKASEKTAMQLRAEMHAAAAKAEASVKTSDKAAAEEAASTATEALEQLRKLRAKPGQSTQHIVDDALLTECETEAIKVGQWATLTKEKVARREKLGGWKAKAFYALDAMVWKVFVHSLALAADQAAAGNLKALPEKVQKSANEAVHFAEDYVGPQRQTSGEVDWQGVSRALKEIKEMPADLRLLLSFLMMASTEFDLAFFELESIPAASLKTAELRAIHRLLLGCSYLSQGYVELGMHEMEEADKLSTDSQLKLDSSGKCCLHLVVGCYFMREKRWADADRCLAAASRAWPDNPLIVYLTGERQIAAHEYAAAEGSFAKVAQGSGFEWLAKKVQARAKRLRDNPASLEPVVFDFNFIAEIVSNSIEDKAQQSESVKKLREQMETAREYMRDLREKLPELKMPELKELFQGSGEKTAEKSTGE